MPRLLDLFCCQGGAAMGYHRAGFDVVGVDIVPQPRYPFEFHQADALEYVAEHGQEFDAIHASPPCQAHSTITPDRSKHVDLIAPTRDLLERLSIPWVMENVEGARRVLHAPMRLCGSSFGLGVRRHRYFESNIWLTSLPCRHAEQAEVYGVYGDHGEDSHLYRHSDGSSRGMRARSTEHARALMGMPWADWHGCAQAIPPAYTEFIGAQLMAALETREVVTA